jgi:hypothetical protein
MMVLDSGTVRSLASSRSTGILPTGQIFVSSALEASFSNSTRCGSNGVPFSYSAMSAFWQKDESGWK